MDKHEFEQFVTEHGKDILRFCRMNAGSTERGNELYQDTMVKLLEKQKKLDAAQNIKSYAMQTAILLWKARKIRINSLEFSFILILQIKRRMKHGTEYDHNQKSVKRI